MKKHLTEGLMPNEQIIREAEFTKVLFAPGIALFVFCFSAFFLLVLSEKAYSFSLAL